MEYSLQLNGVQDTLWIVKLTPPFPLSTITQKFGGNAVNYEQVSGTIRHPGIDFGVPWGTPIQCASELSQCYSDMSKDNPNLGAYRAVFTIVEDDTGIYEIGYGHCSTMSAVPGNTYSTGDILANVGNTGDVFVGSHAVTEAEKEEGSHAGSHLHFQVRVLSKEPSSAPLTPGRHYINDGFGLLTFKGSHYYVPNYDNGYNGCVDPMLFFGKSGFIFSRDLEIGMTSNDVLQLQIRLGVQPQTGYFGPITLQAVKAYQKANAVSTTGFCGPLTRAKLNGTV